MRFMRYIALLALVAFGCQPILDPEDVERYSPPDEYEIWWQEVSSCAGKHGDLGRIQWYRMNDWPKELPCSHSNGCAGLWVPDHTIYLMAQYVLYASVVKHEMLHDLLQSDGHPVPPFGEFVCAPLNR